ncbi:MAG: oligosaccharide flippase family protein [Patescibacteria group bacterium]|nr:oligosaccharide flippase family protein [Patescibacteria group bacterium]
MVRNILNRIAAPIRGLHEAAYVLALLALLSQILALVRDRLLAAAFGAGGTLDIYYAAFRIPDFLFATVASLLSLYALMPVLSRLEEEHPGRMLSFLRQALVLFFVGMGIVGVVAFIAAPWLSHVIAPGFTGATESQLVLLTRILLLQPILLGASNLLANLTQMRNRFLLLAVSPLLYNIGIIIGVVALYPLFGIAGLGWGVILGAFMHMALQVPYFSSERSTARLPLSESLRYLREVLALSVPRTFALASSQISLVILTAIASFFAAGSIAVFMLAYNLQAVPIAIIGVSYSVAAFPTLARLYAKGERGEVSRHVETALRHLLFWSIPATVLTIVLRAELVRVILGAGAFDWSATRLTAAALALFVVSLVAQNVTLLIARTYYAAGNSKKPLYYGIVDIVVSVGSALALAALFHASSATRLFIESLLRVDSLPGTTVLMLALGYALGSIGEAAVGYVFFVRDFAIPQKRIRRLVFQSFGASVIGGGIAYLALAALGGGILSTTLGVFFAGLIAGIAGIAATVLLLHYLGNEELGEAYRALRGRMLTAPAPAIETTDIES